MPEELISLLILAGYFILTFLLRRKKKRDEQARNEEQERDPSPPQYENWPYETEPRREEPKPQPKPQPQRQSQTYHQPQPEAKKEKEPESFEDIFRELFEDRPEEQPKPKPKPVVHQQPQQPQTKKTQPMERTLYKSVDRPNLSQRQMNRPASKQQAEHYAKSIEDSNKIAEEEKAAFAQSDFMEEREKKGIVIDLRQAVIYQAIMERPEH